MALRYFKTEKGARAAVKREGLHLMNYHTCPTKPVTDADRTKYYVHFWVHSLEDKVELESRGFNAVIDTEKAAG